MENIKISLLLTSSEYNTLVYSLQSKKEEITQNLNIAKENLNLYRRLKDNINTSELANSIQELEKSEKDYIKIIENLNSIMLKIKNESEDK